MAKTIMYVAGVVFIVLGLIGFVNDPIFGIFDVDILHNLVHLISGILALIFASQGESQARSLALILGIVYALLTILGFLVGDGKILGLVATNGGSNWLHLIMAIILLIVGLKKPAMSSGGMSSPTM